MCLCVFQAVQNRLYNDHAALYYLLLSKWEKGKLSLSYANPPTPYPRLSISGVPPSVPHINIHKSDTAKATPNGPLGLLGPATAAQVAQGGLLNVGGLPGIHGALEEEPEELIKDPNLDKYLKHGRRHTLGAAHNTLLVNPEQMKR